MISFEHACNTVEENAEETRKSASRVVSQARALVKAAQTGNISAIKRTKEKMEDALEELQEKILVTNHWPYSEEEELELFTSHFLDELKTAATEKDLTLFEGDGVLISYPSIVRILPSDKAVRIDRKKVSTVRPSYLAGMLLANQNKKSGFKSSQFIESLYAIYSDIVSKGQKGQKDLFTDTGEVVLLARIYKLMTALPGISREYDRSDFARDLYLLDSDGPHQTRKGNKVTFPASTGARRRSSDLFSFVGPEGKAVEYYGIRFSQGEQ